MNSEKQQAAAASAFAEQWAGKGYEKGESQPFWLSLLSHVFGIGHPETFIRFESQVKVDKTNFIDGYIDATHVMIEQKKLGTDLTKKEKQSDGKELTPFEQAQRYANALPYSQRPRWIVVCNFETFLVYDMEHPKDAPIDIKLADLGKEYHRLQFLVDVNAANLHKEEMVSLYAGEIVAHIHEALIKQYDDNSAEAQRWLNILCVRIVFCLYAEDAGIFAHDQFYNYLAHYEAKDMRNALLRLFEVLNQPLEKRSKYLQEDLAAFPYTNGGLFAEEIEIPQFTEGLRQTLLQHASLDFDWSDISPTIFGGVFESTLNPMTRRSGGMHYTSIENIHKVIDPLFLNDLRKELDAIKAEKVERTRQKKLTAFQDKLASLTFLDPACGSGNFLTETYLSLRRLENEAIRELYHGQSMMGEFLDPIKVSINQFYGIEINDFAVTVATTALWISEAQMLAETERIIHKDIDFLPLKSYANIREGNALRMNWNEWEIKDDTPFIKAKKVYVYPLQEEKTEMAKEPEFIYDQIDIYTEKTETFTKPKELPTRRVVFDYIISNPPFVGARLMTAEQKADLLHVFGANWKNVGNMDYVSGWYKKSLDLMMGTDTQAALVSTNSLTQGEQVANLWEPLKERNIHINFAYRTFRWDNEASDKAHVHCVVIGFSYINRTDKFIFDGDDVTKAKHINAYLMDADDVLIGSRSKALCDVPEIGIGNKPIDGGNYLFTKEEMDAFIKKEPLSATYFRPWYGAEEFIHQNPRYCLWLGDCSPAEIKKMPHCLEKVAAVRNLRLQSKSAGTRKLADRPTRFHVENMPATSYIIIPSTSSERRRYIPMGFLSPEAISSNAVHLISDATLYHFGVLESNVHMAWTRAICGRLKSDYRYSKDIVYNNFPWPTPNEEQKAKIEITAQAILDARAMYPDSSLADLYDETIMPIELRKAHQANDRAVMEAYGFDPKQMADNEPLIVAKLFKLYQELTKENYSFSSGFFVK